MRSTSALLTLSLCCALPCPAADWSQSLGPLPAPFHYNVPRASLPEFVKVRIPVTVKVWEHGRDVGTVGLARGVRLRVLEIDRSGILSVEFAGARCFVDHAATDFIERLR